MAADLGTVFSQIGCPRILVIGDVILDRYIWGNADRVSPEAPVLVLRADEEEVRLGGAASVAMLLSALGAQPILSGVIGDDSDGRIARALMVEAKIDHSGVLCDSDRMTTAKDRFIGRAANRHPSQILRVDRELCEPIPKAIEDRLIEALIERLGEVQVVLVSDYAKGVCTPHVLEALIEAAAVRGIPVFVDPARIAD